MPKLLLPHYLKQPLSLPCETAPVEILAFLHSLCRLNPHLQHYIFADAAQSQLQTSTAFYVNGEALHRLLQANPNYPLQAEDVLEIEPAMVGG